MSGHDLTQPSIDWDQTQNLGQNTNFLQGPDVFSVRLSYLYHSHLSECHSETHIKHNAGNTGCWIIHAYGIWEFQLSCHHGTTGKPMHLIDFV